MFKVGDKVRASKDCDKPSIIGLTGKVTYCNDGGTYETDIALGLHNWRSGELEKIGDRSMKYYRVLKDTPLWVSGAIVQYNEENDGYGPISDLWNRVESNDNILEHANAVEAKENSDFFERVYEASHLGKLTYVTKEKAQALAAKFFDGNKKSE